jgi:competence ComEA-like helix-hairpin-helix protein
MATSTLAKSILHLFCVSLILALVLIGSPQVLAKKTPPTHPLDLNTATAKELEQLPGVGPTTAKAIVDFRTKGGHFRRISDLLVIRGISDAKLKKMRPYITIGPPAAGLAKKPSPAGTTGDSNH